MEKIVECVPNFSEGIDLQKIEEIKKAILSVNDIVLLDVDPGAATNRTVVTFVGQPEAVGEAAFRAIKKASEVIDMSTHKGEHPRMGATDVCPFVPVANMNMDETVELSRKVAERVGEELNIPVFLYEYSAIKKENRSLAHIREGEYEKMEEKLKREDFNPDFGPKKFHKEAGVTAIGAREFLIAYNLNLNTKNVKIANKIAKEIREKGKVIKQKDGTKKQVPGLLKSVRAVGWYIDEYGIAQISVNLINYKITPLWKLFETAVMVAEKHGIRITGSELVGLMPLQALKETGEHFLHKAGNMRGIPEKTVLDIAVRSLGLSELYQFNLSDKVIEYKIAKRGILTSLSLNDFNNELSSDSPAPGGGSVAALSGSISASLVSMVANLTFGKKKYQNGWKKAEEIGMKAQKIKDEIMKIVDSDTELFNDYMTARKLPKGTLEQKTLRKEKIEEASIKITESPLGLLRKLSELPNILIIIAKKGNQNSISDVGVAASMLRSASEGAYLNVLINLPSIENKELQRQFKEEAEILYKKLITASNSVYRKILKNLKQ
jgi:glutamate formiminotransferase/formiminotetrahydrofolate cyclodeaminase